MHAKKRIMAEHRALRWADVPAASRPPLQELVDSAVRDWLGDPSRPAFASRHGFRVLDDLRVDAYRQHRFARGDAGLITLSSVDLSGTLEVAEPDLFVTALTKGVGRAKAFGCGLLLVRRT
jgi:CRISPR system Cascade subunit CasE